MLQGSLMNRPYLRCRWSETIMQASVLSREPNMEVEVFRRAILM